MGVRKKTYTDRAGKKRSARKWSGWFTDHRGLQRELTLYPDKRASMMIVERIEHLVAYRVAGAPLPPDLARWLRDCPASILDKLVAWRIIDPREIATQIPIDELIDQWIESIRARGASRSWITHQMNYMRRLSRECEWIFWEDLDADILQKTVSGWNLKTKTKNDYIASAKQFSAWFADRNGIPSPLARVRPITNVGALVRRALTDEELQRLYHTAETGPDRMRLTGHQRMILYRLAAETGLRANELRQLRRDDITIDPDGWGRVSVRAEIAKNRTAITLPLPPEISTLVADIKLVDRADKSLFGTLSKPERIFAFDSERAGIARDTPAGRATFHSLRHTFVTRLARAGVHPSVAKLLSRHATMAVLERYTHRTFDDMRAAMEQLTE